MKVVINTDFGGYSLSRKAIDRLIDLGSKETATYLKELGKDYPHSYDNYYVFMSDHKRADPLLIQVIEELGKDAWGELSKLKIVEIPDDIEWYIHEYDGWESVHEAHRSWE